MKRGKLWVLLYVLLIVGTLAAAEWGSRAVTTMIKTAPMESGICIVIDPGHGGEDGGATSCTGRLESTYNLEIALRLNDLFHLLGCNTQMIRTTDTSVYTKGETIAQKKVSDLKERVRIVNETDNALLLSIHQNNFSDSRYSGAQVFYAETPGSEQLAKLLQGQLVSALNPGSNRKSKKSDGLYLMEHIDCTGVLIECGFLSNAAEEARLRNGDYQKKLCCVIAATVREYLSNA
ncbi:MAG: N-acetylmuramoyl-L-alanine amidase [Firmicutes bacterium]|nr:N-acetylmuramoyl-L-alanine amidase [Bacillota bacterium]